MVENVLNGCGENYIKVLPNTKYTISADKIVDAIRLSEYTIETAHIKRSQKSTSKYLTITTTENTRYLRWSLNYDGPNSVTVTTEMLENLKLRLTLGSDIKPYTEGPKTIPLPLGDIELRSTPDGTRDTFARVDGVWNKVSSVGNGVLDGTETWEGTPSYYTRVFDSLVGAVPSATKFTGLSNYFKVYGFNHVEGQNLYFHPNSKALHVRNANNTYYATMQEWKDWLSAHPTEVIYPLATPTYTPITDQGLISALDELEQLVLHKGYNRITVTGVNGVKAYLDLNYYKDINIVLENINTKLGGV